MNRSGRVCSVLSFSGVCNKSMDGDNTCLFRLSPGIVKFFNCMRNKITFLAIFLAIGPRASMARESIPRDTVGVKVYFRQGHASLDSLFRDNAPAWTRSPAVCPRFGVIPPSRFDRFASFPGLPRRVPLKSTGACRNAVPRLSGRTWKSGFLWKVTLSMSNPVA